jgi:hypothetical protein
VVEPEMEVPLPEEGQLVVTEKGVVWCKVRFAFNPRSDRPYKLHFKDPISIIPDTDAVTGSMLIG